MIWRILKWFFCMVPELKSKIAIIGAGPAGCICAYYLQKHYEVTLFDFSSPLRTLLPTGGGRCNLAYAEYDFKELAKNYPRGEKFLYSAFSRFSTWDTIAFFDEIGISTYMQDDMRIFPVSNSSKDVRDKFLGALNEVKFKREKVLRVERCNYLFRVITEQNTYNTDGIVISTGGHASYNIIKYLGHKIVPPVPSLVGLKTEENNSQLAGVSLKNVSARFENKDLTGDLLFTHEGVSGPLVYKISSLMARKGFPYEIHFDFTGDISLQNILNDNPHKSIKNILSDFVPKSLAIFILNMLNISEEEKAHKIDGKTRDRILSALNDFKVTVVSTAKDGEVVTSGGVDLNEVNPKTMESKIEAGVYFCGEVLDVDGFCGGFNLQNCWSTGYTAAQGIIQA